MSVMLLVLLPVLLAGAMIHGREVKPLVPGIMIFGDSLVDVGNNNYINTFVKANINPYGRDFEDHVATGRFCNGKLLSDIIAEKPGFSSSPPAYLSPRASGQKILTGANFASAGSGYYGPTARKYNVSTTSQLEYFKEYRSNLAVVAGSNQAKSIISDSVYIISAGANDFGVNYYGNPWLFSTHTAEQFSDRLVSIFNNTVNQLYIMGARRIGVFSLPPLGCVPLVITVFGLGRSGCVPRINNDAQRFNTKLGVVADSLSERYHDLRITVMDIYTPWHSLAKSPWLQGFNEARRGCCSTGLLESTLFLCNPLSVGTCSNATTYVHWDSLHPTEAANRVIVDSLVEAINKLLTT